jgi:hypothetical protein
MPTIAFGFIVEDIILSPTISPKVENKSMKKTMRLQPMNYRARNPRNKAGEIWIGIAGVGFPMRAENIKEKNGEITFTRLVDGKDGKRTEKVTTKKQHVIYMSETLEVE